MKNIFITAALLFMCAQNADADGGTEKTYSSIQEVSKQFIIDYISRKKFREMKYSYDGDLYEPAFFDFTSEKDLKKMDKAALAKYVATLTVTEEKEAGGRSLVIKDQKGNVVASVRLKKF